MQDLAWQIGQTKQSMITHMYYEQGMANFTTHDIKMTLLYQRNHYKTKAMNKKSALRE